MGVEEHLSLTQLQLLIKERMDEAFPMPLWVVAEISELKVNYSGHCYLELVEKGGRNQVPKAKANAVIWRSTYGAIDSCFRAMTGGCLEVGMKVLVRISVMYHELYGLSLRISDIDPRFTLGDMEQQRQQTIAQLKEDGVFDMNRELKIPAIIQRIAVISSRSAAGFEDFMNELAASPYRFETTLFDAFMQGHGSEDSIVVALDQVLERIEEFDVLVLIRGGGSQSDLSSFDSYRLCSHISQFPLPIITGIGHDKDQSVADLVAAISLKTPTAVAVFLVDGLKETDVYMDRLYENVVSFVSTIVESEQHRLKDMVYEISHSTTIMTRSVEASLQRLAAEVRRVGGANVANMFNRLFLVEHTLKQQAQRAIDDGKNNLISIQRLVDSRSPEKLMSLGFAIVRSGGKAVKSAFELQKGATVDISFAQGGAEAEIKQIIKVKK